MKRQKSLVAGKKKDEKSEEKSGYECSCGEATCVMWACHRKESV
jgi:hypothetical protein